MKSNIDTYNKYMLATYFNFLRRKFSYKIKYNNNFNLFEKIWINLQLLHEQMVF